MLTKLEEQILMTAWRFNGQGYGMNIYERLNEIVDGKISLGVVYDTLERLKKNGLVETHLGEASPVRGGMRKKFYTITKTGIEELIRSKEIHDKVMDSFNELLERYKAKF